MLEVLAAVSAVDAEMIVCKSPAELETMHRAGLVVWDVLNDLRETVRPGVTTLDLESLRSAHGGT